MRILVFAPHPDDEIIGCGGTMARYIAEGNDVFVCVVTSPKPPVYNDQLAVKNGWPHLIFPEIKASHEKIGVKDTIFLQFPCVLLEKEPRNEVNKKIYQVIQDIKPEIVFIPHFGDMQKDHAIVSEAVMVGVRPKYAHVPQYVYSYECLSETEWNIPHAANAFIPDTFIDISAYLPQKIEAMSCYKSQLGQFPDPRSCEAMEALAKLRGSTAGFMAAEAFSLIREYRKGVKMVQQERIKKLVLIGAGGLGREVAQMIESLNLIEKKYELLGFLDDGKQFDADSLINGYPLLGNSDWILEHKNDVVCNCTIGNSSLRAKIQRRLMAQGVQFETIKAPTAGVAKYTEIGVGCILSWGVGISVNCKIGNGVLLNDGVKVGHDVKISDYTAIMSETGISGNCVIGEEVDIGGHAFIIPGKKVGDRARIAAGSIVFSNVKAGTTVLGNPAKRMKELE